MDLIYGSLYYSDHLSSRAIDEITVGEGCIGYAVITIKRSPVGNDYDIKYSHFDVDGYENPLLLQNFPAFCDMVDTAMLQDRQVIVHDTEYNGMLSWFMITAYMVAATPVMKTLRKDSQQALEYMCARTRNTGHFARWQNEPATWSTTIYTQLSIWQELRYKLHSEVNGVVGEDPRYFDWLVAQIRIKEGH